MSRGEVTISTHNGSTVAVAHNLREPEICSHESHIDPEGVHEVWLHKDLREFYEETFGEAQREYDSRARASRRVGDYLDKLTKEAAEGEEENEKIRARNKAHQAAGEKAEKLKVVKKPVYEEICGVYAQGELELTDDECREMLHLYVMGDGTPEHPSWQERNPGLRMVGAYYHADEPDGVGPHVHIDYVPVAEFSKGMRVQNSLEGALKLRGLSSGKVMCLDGEERFKSAQEQWTDSENDTLQSICEGYDLDVIHPKRGKGSVHLSTAELKIARQIEEAHKALDAREESISRQEAGLSIRANALADERKRLDAEREQLKKDQEQLASDRTAAKLQEAKAKQAEAKAETEAKRAAEARKTALEAIKECKRIKLTAEERKSLEEVYKALGHFENIKQPGQQPGKQYGLDV